DPFENQVAGRVRRLLEAVNGGDVGMIERCQELGFTLEASELLRVARELRWQRLDGDLAVELSVARQIHHAHATAAQLAFDEVVTQCLWRRARRRVQLIRLDRHTLLESRWGP